MPAQSFKAGLTNDLDQVDLVLWKSDTAGPLKVEIRTLLGGVRSQDPPLASASVAATDVPTGHRAQDWVSVPLSPPAPIVAGTPYAIVLSDAEPPLSAA